MTIETDAIGSDGWHLARLARKMEARQPRLQELDDWWRGEPPLPEGAENMREAYEVFQRKARTHFAFLVVESVRERMRVQGFRTGATGDENGDQQAAAIWRRNGMGVKSAEVHSTFLAMGDGYVIVGEREDEPGVPLITDEDPRQVVTEHDPRDQSVVKRALKVFHDDEAERDYAYLYLAGVDGGLAQVRVASSERRVALAAKRASRRRSTGARIIPEPLRRDEPIPVRFSPSSWDWDEDLSGPIAWTKRCPVVRFRNRRGVGEFEEHLDVLGRINHQILQRMVIATMQAFRQRAIKNAPQFDESGNEIDYAELLKADPGAVWTLPEAVEMWESGQVDLTPILAAVKDDVTYLAAVTKSPLFYLFPDAANGSAEGASLMREGLVFRGEDRVERASEGWIDVMSLSFEVMGDAERADRLLIDPLWAPVERRSLAERADAGAKATDIPWRTKMIEIWQFTPAEVDRMESERQGEQLMAAALAPPPAPAPAQPAPDAATPPENAPPDANG